MLSFKESGLLYDNIVVVIVAVVVVVVIVCLCEHTFNKMPFNSLFDFIHSINKVHKFVKEKEKTVYECVYVCYWCSYCCCFSYRWIADSSIHPSIYLSTCLIQQFPASHDAAFFSSVSPLSFKHLNIVIIIRQLETVAFAFCFISHGQYVYEATYKNHDFIFIFFSFSAYICAVWDMLNKLMNERIVISI